MLQSHAFLGSGCHIVWALGNPHPLTPGTSFDTSFSTSWRQSSCPMGVLRKWRLDAASTGGVEGTDGIWRFRTLP
jgi:hypothetical protein